MEQEIIVRQNDNFIDAVEALMVAKDNPILCDVQHTFTKGLYTRKILIPAGTLLSSKIHGTEHQYAVLHGLIEVSVDGQPSQLMAGGFSGITKIGTRRLLLAHTDTIWITMHPTDIVPESDSEDDIIKAANQVEEIIIIKRENEFLNNKNLLECLLPQLQLD